MIEGFTSPSWTGMLDAVMIRNGAARVERNADRDEFRISVPTCKPWYYVPPVTWIVHSSAERITVLDALGRLVWDLCDGKNSVENIIDVFAEKYGLTFHESRVSVTQHLKHLISRGALAVSL